MPSEAAPNQPNSTLIKQFLQRLPIISELPDEDLERLSQRVEVAEVPAGQTVIEEGRSADSLYIIVDGELEVSKRIGQIDVTLAVRRPGDFVGERALIEQTPRSASVRTLRDSRLLVVSQDLFREVLASSPAAQMAILRTIALRLESTESLLMQHQKMAALGTLAAGLAHELNNPAAAIGRTAEHFQGVLSIWEHLIGELSRAALNEQQRATVQALRQEAKERSTTGSRLDSVALMNQEELLQDWLEAHEVPEPWNLAPDLAAAGWDTARLEQLAHDFSPAQFSALVQWLAVSGSVYSLVDELRKSASAISEVVQAVKTYTYLGQAPVQTIDVRDSIENTLVILRNQLKKGISIAREYEDDIPLIEAHGSELNQVWTNIIQNAAEAMEGHGNITIRVARENDKFIRVEITDSGPGIDPEQQHRIFEPFFTTKPPGIGTGLGLYISYSIIVLNHRGTITVKSRPGNTRFKIVLPIRHPQILTTQESETPANLTNPLT